MVRLRAFCHCRLSLAAIVALVIALLTAAPSTAQFSDPDPDEVFFCGFQLGTDCDFQSASAQCQLLRSDECLRFTSNRFEEFGVREVFARVTRTGTRYDFNAFTDTACTQNPFGLEVFARNLALNVCGSLTVNLIGDQLDVLLTHECPLCERDDANIDLNQQTLPDGIGFHPFPRIGRAPICGGERLACEQLGYQSTDVVLSNQQIAPFHELNEDFIWCNGSLTRATEPYHRHVIKELWCNDTLSPTEVFQTNVLTISQPSRYIELNTEFTVTPEILWSARTPFNLTERNLRIEIDSPAGFYVVYDPPALPPFTLHTIAHFPSSGASVRVPTITRPTVQNTNFLHQLWSRTHGIFESSAAGFFFGKYEPLLVEVPKFSEHRADLVFVSPAVLSGFSIGAGDAVEVETLAYESDARAPELRSADDERLLTPAEAATARLHELTFPGVPQGTTKITGSVTPNVNAYTHASFPSFGPLALSSSATLRRFGDTLVTACFYPTPVLCELQARSTHCMHIPIRACLSPEEVGGGLPSRLGSFRLDFVGESILGSFFSDPYCSNFGEALLSGFDYHQCFNDRLGTGLVFKVLPDVCTRATCRDSDAYVLNAEQVLLEAFTGYTFARAYQYQSTFPVTVMASGVLFEQTATTVARFRALVPNYSTEQVHFLFFAACVNATAGETRKLFYSPDMLGGVVRSTSFVAIDCDKGLQWASAGVFDLEPSVGPLASTDRIVYINFGLEAGVFLDRLAIVDAAAGLSQHVLTGISLPPLPPLPNGVTPAAQTGATVCAEFDRASCPQSCIYNFPSAHAVSSADGGQCSAVLGGSAATCATMSLCFQNTTVAQQQPGMVAEDGDTCVRLRALSDMKAVAQPPTERSDLLYARRWVGSGVVFFLAAHNSSRFSANATSHPHTVISYVIRSDNDDAAESVLPFASLRSIVDARGVAAVTITPTNLLDSPALSSSPAGRPLTASDYQQVLSPRVFSQLDGIGTYVDQTAVVRCGCIGIGSVVLATAPTNAILSFHTVIANPVNVTVYDGAGATKVDGAQHSWTPEGLLNISHLSPETAYTVTLQSIDAKCSQDDEGVEVHRFTTPAFFPKPVLTRLETTNIREVLVEWTFDARATGYRLQDIQYAFRRDGRYIPEGGPASAFQGPVLLGHATDRFFGPTPSANATRDRDGEPMNGGGSRSGGNATQEAVLRPCAVDPFGKAQVDAWGANVFSSLVQNVRYTYDETHMIELDVMHRIAKTPITETLVIVSPLAPYPTRPTLQITTSRVDVYDTEFLLTLEWDPVPLTNGSDALHYRIRAQSTHDDGSIHTNIDTFVTGTSYSRWYEGAFADTFLRPSISVEVAGIACTLPTLEACNAYTLTEFIRSDIIAGNISLSDIEFVEPASSPPVIISHDAVGGNGIDFTVFLAGSQVLGLTYWVAVDANGVTRQTSETIDVTPILVQAATEETQGVAVYRLLASLTASTTYNVVVSTVNTQSAEYSFRTASVPAAIPAAFSLAALTATTATVRFSTPNPANGDVHQYSLHVVPPAAPGTVTAGDLTHAAVVRAGAADAAAGGGTSQSLQQGRATPSPSSYVVSIVGLSPGVTYTVEVAAHTREMGQGAVARLEATTPFSQRLESSGTPIDGSSASASSSIEVGGVIAAILVGIIFGTVVALVIWRRVDAGVEAAGDGKYDITEEIVDRFHVRFPSVSAVLDIEQHIKACIVPRSSVMVEHQLKAGRSGSFHKAKLARRGSSNIYVLRLFQSTTEFHSATLLSEAFIFSKMEHNNLMSCSGFVCNSKPYLYCMDLIPTITLQEYLVEGRQIQFGPQVFTPQRLLAIAQDVASATAILHVHGVTNGALAANQLCVTDAGVVKIHQLARFAGSNTSQVAIIPAWKPLEMLLDADCALTRECDSWQMGLLLWQILSFGEAPFPSLTKDEIIEHITSGNMPPSPRDASDAALELMRQCWDHDPSRRPSMTAVANKIESAIQGIGVKKTFSLNKKYNFGGL